MAVQAGDVMLVTFAGTLAGSKILNTFHYGMSIVVGAPSQAAVAIEVTAKLQSAANLVDKFLGCCPPAYTMDEMWVQFILDTRFRKSVFAIGSPGTFAQDANTANLAGVITRRGPAANRYNLGSLHIPYPNLDPGLTNGVVSGAWKTEADILAAEVDNSQVLATLGTIVPILISGTSKLNAKPIDDAFAQTTVRTMRRRTKGVGI